MTPPSPAITPSTLVFSLASQCSPLHSLSSSPSPERQWPRACPPLELPSLFRSIPSTPPPLSASFLLPELRIRLTVLGRDLPAQVSLPRALNHSSGPRRSSPQRRSAPQRSIFLPCYQTYFVRRSLLSRMHSLPRALPVCGGRYYRESAAGPPLPVANSLRPPSGHATRWNRVAQVRRARQCPRI